MIDLLLSCCLLFTVQDTAGPAPMDPVLRDLLPAAEARTRAAAFGAIEAFPEPQYLAPLVDLLRLADTAEEWFAILDAGSAVLGEDLRALEQPWRKLTLRMAGSQDVELPRGYATWKGQLLGQLVDERFTEFLNDAAVSRVALHEVVWGGVGVGGIPALQQPATLEAGEATWLLSEEPVVGLAVGGEARAYPLRILDWHELANDRLGGRPISLTWCTLCGAAVAFVAERDGAELRFDSSGLLMRSNKLMFDAGTKTLWNQLTGEPVIGPLAEPEGRVPLEVLPSEIVAWSDWRARHPETTVVDRATGHERDYRPGAAYGEYFGRRATMFPGAGPLGEDLERAKRRRVAVRTAGGTRTYDLQRLRAEGVVHDTIGGTALVLVADPGAGPRPLPSSWVTTLEELGRAPVASMGGLGLEDLQAVLGAAPERLDELGLEDLSGLDWSVRARLLEGIEIQGEELRVAVALRGLAASRGLVDGVRVFASGGQRFERGEDSGELLDAKGGSWRIGAEALEGPNGERLARLPSHGLFAFAAESFGLDSR